jgi:2-succinyl-6-hydroxy-2,4-cyclohexadiene-1-carboxylate synthase
VDSDPRPLVCLHGFTYTGAQFNELSKHVDIPLVAPDLHPGAPLTLEGTLFAIEDVINVIGGPVPVLGYSMGGRLALWLALERPDLVDGLIVISSGAGIADPEKRAERRAADRELAERITEHDVPTFLDDWLSRPLTSTAFLSPDAAARDRAIREENSAAGLAAALDTFGQGSFPYLGDRLAGLRPPLLAVSGQHDRRYTDEAAALTAAVSNGRHVIIPGVGHNVVAEAPEALASVVKEFVES